jgi:sRNA-binding regulator protein Hfq
MVKKPEANGRNVVLLIAVIVAVGTANVGGATAAETNLLQLAKERFTNDLSVAEEKLFRAVARGEEFHFTTGSAKEDDPANSSNWGKDRVIRADRLAWLCTDAAASALVTYRGISISGLRIEGVLDLEWANVAFPISALNCAFKNSILLTECHLCALCLDGTHIKDLRADGLRVERELFLRNGFRADGEVRLLSASIGGNLECDGSQFINPNAIALFADGVKIEGHVFLRNNFSAHGAVLLLYATIGKGMDCHGGQFANSNAVALNANGAKIEGPVLLYKGFKAEGNVQFSAATISGDLDCHGGQFANSNAVALSANGAKISGNMFLSGGFKAEGEVQIQGAEIGRELDCGSGQFINPQGLALVAHLAKIEGAVILGAGFKAEGGVTLLGATIGGSLECSGGQFVNTNTNAFALDAEQAKIEGSVFLRKGFEADGQVSFAIAYITRSFQWRSVKSPEKAILDLRSARVGTLWDDKTSWPRVGNLFLDNFVYDEIYSDAPAKAESRIAWLQRQPTDQFLPQPYEQLAGVLRKMGHEDEAAKVMIAKNRDYAAHLPWYSVSRLWYNLIGELAGYGYLPGRAFKISLGFILFGWRLFKACYRRGIVVPTDSSRAYSKDAARAHRLSEDYPRFNAFIYSLEKFVPLLSLEMGQHWLPDANRGTWLRLHNRNLLTSGSLLRCYLWFHIISGWILTTLWIGGITGLVKT